MPLRIQKQIKILPAKTKTIRILKFRFLTSLNSTKFLRKDTAVVGAEIT